MRKVLSLLAVGVFVLAGSMVASAGWMVNSQGQLVFQAGQVLSQGSDNEGESNSGSSGSSEGGSNSSSGSSGPASSPAPTKTETEVRVGEEDRIKVRTEENKQRIEVRSGDSRVRFEQKDGRLIIKAENEAGEETEVGEEELFEINQREDKDQIKVATGSGTAVVFARGQVGASTTLPISVDLTTNALQVTTPAGTKMVAILPEAAVTNLLAANIIDRLGAEALTAASNAGSLTGVVRQVIQLAQRNGEAVYEIRGLSDQQLLGFLPVEVKRTVVVSAETGEVVEQQQLLLDRVVDMLSF